MEIGTIASTTAVADDDGLVLTQASRQPGDVRCEGEGVVPVWWVIRAPVAAHIDGDRPIASISKCSDLLSPGPPERRKSVEEQDSRAFSLLDHVKARAIG